MSAVEVVREAVKGASEGIAGASGAEDQAEMFALPVEDPRGRIAAAREASSRGGRPKGAQNLQTRELRDWLLRRGVLPQQAMMEWLTLGPIGLAEALCCSRLEAFDRWSKLVAELGRYFMAPMVPVDAEGKPAPQFLVSIGGQFGLPSATGGEARPPWDYLTEQNQEVAPGDGASVESGEA